MTNTKTLDETLFQLQGKVTCGGCGIEESMRFELQGRDALILRLPIGWRYGALRGEIYREVCKPVCSWVCQSQVEDGD